MVGPSAQALSEDERLLRSSLIAAQLMGLAFMCFVRVRQDVSCLCRPEQ
jgi:hypothetical protein